MTALLSINKLSVALQQKDILSTVDLSLMDGDIMGLVGPSGCGKTTLLNTIAGFVEQTSGSLTFFGESPIDTGNRVAPERRNIGMIFQDYALFPHLTVWQNIAFGLKKLTTIEKSARIKQLLALLKLSDFSARYPHQLSGGQQQRVAIARALAPQPKLLLLDEPFSNIDARLRNELMLELRVLLKQLNMSAIFVTHNKDEVFTFADKIAVMHKGEVLQSGKPADVFQKPENWQVADFLQIGSWLPVIKKNKTFETALGSLSESISIASLDTAKKNEAYFLLLKPQHIVLEASNPANVKIDYVGINEQGFHYILSSLTDETALKFEQLNFYSQTAYPQGQLLSIRVNAHEYQLFSQ